MNRGVLAFADTVGTVRVGQHLKRLVMVDEPIDQGLCALVVDIVVARAVDEQEMAFELMREMER